MKTRAEIARYIERQLDWRHKPKLEKGSKHHYGLQELRELLDFAFDSPPQTEEEKIRNIPPVFNKRPTP